MLLFSGKKEIDFIRNDVAGMLLYDVTLIKIWLKIILTNNF